MSTTYVTIVLQFFLQFFIPMNPHSVEIKNSVVAKNHIIRMEEVDKSITIHMDNSEKFVFVYGTQKEADKDFRKDKRRNWRCGLNA